MEKLFFQPGFENINFVQIIRHNNEKRSRVSWKIFFFVQQSFPQYFSHVSACTIEIDIAHQEAVIGLVKNTYFACIVQFSFLRLFRSKSIYGLIGWFVSYVMLLRFRISWKFGRKTVNNFIHFLIDVTKHSNRTHSHFIVKRHEYSWLSRYAHISCFRFVCKK